jgi:arylsulfatase
VVQAHLASFREFPIRQVGLSANVGKTIEGVQDQLLKLEETGE